MAQSSPAPADLSGVLLAAHPGLLDPNFRRKVVLVSAHSEEEGAMGVIVNSPMGSTLGEFDPEFEFEPLGQVPLYHGGPVDETEVIFAAWQWRAEEGVFRLVFGIDLDQARSLMLEEDYEVRGFLGYSGWEKGQLEAEMAQNSWLLSSIDGEMLTGRQGPKLWREILRSVSPEMKILAEAPEDPSVN